MPFLGRTKIPDSITMPSFWRRRGPTLVVFVVLAMVVLFDRSVDRAPVEPTPSADFARYHDRIFRVAYVVDGDTLDISMPDGRQPVTRIRLWGVDCPEEARGEEAVDMHFATEASEYARNTLTDRDVHLVLSPERTRGKYGRLLAYVFLERGGRMFNEMLLEEGYAYADLRFRHHNYERFKRIEKGARRGGVGLWSEVTLDKMPTWRQRFEQR